MNVFACYSILREFLLIVFGDIKLRLYSYSSHFQTRATLVLANFHRGQGQLHKLVYKTSMHKRDKRPPQKRGIQKRQR